MANVTSGNPITIDTTGTITTDKIRVQSVMVVASNDTPVVVLTDNDDNEIYRFTTAITNMRAWESPIGPTEWNGIKADTLTNITKVFVYKTAFVPSLLKV